MNLIDDLNVIEYVIACRHRSVFDGAVCQGVNESSCRGVAVMLDTNWELQVSNTNP